MKLRETIARTFYPGATYGVQCVKCKSIKVHPADFRDRISFREFEISSLCQKCQDSIFGVDNE